jgi:hypothetical protein
MLEVLKFITVVLVSGFGAWAGSYFNSYAKTKGENLATHEDIGMLVDQIKAVTQTAKEIEAKISNEVWDRQRRWELKRDTLFTAAQRAAEALEILNSFYAMHTVVAADPKADTPYMVTRKGEKMASWSLISAALSESSLLVRIVCGKEVSRVFEEFRTAINNHALALLTIDKDRIEPTRTDSIGTSMKFEIVMRKDLGIEAA